MSAPSQAAVQRPASASPYRPWTPDRPNEAGGRTLTMKRCCNGCGEQLGDITDEELCAAVAGEPVPDVRAECPACSLMLGRWHPDIVRFRILDRIAERGAARVLAGAYTDPGQYCERSRQGDADYVEYEPVHDWASRAVALVTQVVEAEAERTGIVKVLRDLAGNDALDDETRDALRSLADRFETRGVTL